MGRVFHIGMESGNYAVTGITASEPAQQKSFLQQSFGRGFDESRANDALLNLPVSSPTPKTGM